MNSTLKDLKERRSIKSYKDIQIKDEDLNEILEAGMNAPTGRNMQSPVMVVVQKKELIKKIERLNAAALNSDAKTFYGAPTVVIVFADKNANTYLYDGSLVMGNLMNAAHSLGLGSCWVHRAKEVFETREGKELMKQWGLGDNYEGIGNCLLGYADCEYPEKKIRKENYVIKA